jgi:hypothetical protein
VDRQACACDSQKMCHYQKIYHDYVSGLYGPHRFLSAEEKLQYDQKVEEEIQHFFDQFPFLINSASKKYHIYKISVRAHQNEEKKKNSKTFFQINGREIDGVHK